MPCWSIMLLWLMSLGSACAASVVEDAHCRVELLPVTTAVAPGDEAVVLLRWTPDPGWHGYWANPGESGMPARLDWALPAGWSVVDAAMPVPETFSVGGVRSFGYGRPWITEHRFVAIEDDPADLDLALSAQWLTCADICVAGSGRVRATIPVAATTHTSPEAAALRAATAQHRPVRELADWSADLEGAVLVVTGPATGPQRLTCFPRTERAFTTERAIEAERGLDGRWIFRLPLRPEVAGATLLLVADGGFAGPDSPRGWLIDVTRSP